MPSTRSAARLAMTLICCSATLAGAQQPNTNSVQFKGPGASSSVPSDPAQRREFRSRQRAAVEEQNPELQRALQLDANTTKALLELLTDQQIERSMAAQTMGSTNDMQAIADAETRRLDELSKLLGEDGLRRYQKYEATRTQHGQLSHLDTRLGPNDKLEAAQRERLIELLVKQFEWETSQKLSQSRAVLSSTLPGNLFVQDLQRSSELRTIEANQHSLRYMRESSVPMLREASAFLTPVQLQALAKMEDERTDSLRQWVEQARTQAGLDPAIPETTPTVDSNPPLRKPVSGDIRLGIRMTVDRSDGVTVSLDGRNGEPRSFEVAEGLIVEAIPTLFDDDWLDVKFNFYEKDAQGQRRRLPSSTGIGRPRALDANPSVYDGMSSTVVHGRKAYAVTTRVRVERV